MVKTKSFELTMKEIVQVVSDRLVQQGDLDAQRYRVETHVPENGCRAEETIRFTFHPVAPEGEEG